MSTFYLLPPRSFLAERLVERLTPWFPELAGGASSGREVVEAITTILHRADVYLLHREDLPAGEETARALVDGFGAEPGDEVIEVRAGGPAGEPVVRRWRLGAT
jgi:hypothetical protein